MLPNSLAQTVDGQGWQLKYADEFDGTELDREFWSHEVNCSGGGNNEQQCYTARSENSFVKDGLLHLVAKEKAHSGSPYFDDDPDYDANDRSKTLPFTSARVRSKNKVDFKYGRVEARAKVPQGYGIWPAIWMLPTDNVYGRWPRSGEIDILEAVNLGVWDNEIHGTLHYGLPWPQWENHGDHYKFDHNPADQFHVYAIEWEADEIRWYVDGQHYQTQRSEGWYNYIWKGQDTGFKVVNPRAPFDQRFHLILNLAIGGDWPGAPKTPWQADKVMLVDYVRVYQCSPDDISDAMRANGEGCASVDPAITVNKDAGQPVVKDINLYVDAPMQLEFASSEQDVMNIVPSARHSKLKVQPSDVAQSWRLQLAAGQQESLQLSQSQTSHSSVSLLGGSSWRHNGEIELDIKIESASSNSQFYVGLIDKQGKVLEQQLDPIETGQWHTVHVAFAQMLGLMTKRAKLVDKEQLKQRFDFDQVVTPFYIRHQGDQAAEVQLNNVKLQCAYNPEPEDWQADKVCGISRSPA